MKKLLVFVLIFLLYFVFVVNAQTIDFNIIMDKTSFLRYEIISFKVDLKQDGSPVTNADVTARFYNSTGDLIETVGSMQSVSLYYNSSDQLWYGYWSIPWNPDLGIYILEVNANISGSLYTESTTFNINMRQPREVLPQGFLAMTAENIEDLTGFNVPGPYGEPGNWLNMFKWAEFMGADSFWPTAGQIYGGYCGEVNQSFPWCSVSYQSSEEYCMQANASGFRCAPWLWPYSAGEPDNLESRYGVTFNWTMYYDCSSDTLNERKGDISVLDERAINHTVKMIEILSSRPDVNTIGIDWEPSGDVDLRLANDEFARKMNVQVPSEWWSTYTIQDKMIWIGSRITYGCSNYNIDFAEVWHRWMAYNYALTLKKIIEESDTSKNFFMYTWSANLGRGAGHDPFIFNDAGIDIIAPMTYTAPSGISSGESCWYEGAIIDSYGKELTSEKFPNLLPGQIVWDRAYRDCSYQNYRDPPATEDMYNRIIYSGKNSYRNGTIAGFFWHDILRAVSLGHATPDPYTDIEYAIAGGAAASELRLEAERIPINMSIETLDETDYGDVIDGNITVTNLGNTTLDATVFLINNTPGWEFVSAPNTVISLSPSETQKISFNVKSNLIDYDVDNRFMIAAKSMWGSKTTDTHLEFKYVYVSPRSMISGRLKNINNESVQSNVIVYEEGTENIISSYQTDSNGVYNLNIPSGIYDIEFNLTDYNIQGFSIKLKSTDMSYDLSEPIKYVTYNSSENFVSIIIDIEKPITIDINSQHKPTKILKNGTSIEKISSLSGIDNNKWFYNETEQKIYLMIDRYLEGFAPLFGMTEIGVGTGWTPYLYTAGPYDVENTLTVSSIYLYTPVAGNAKVALYDAIYNENRYATLHDPNNIIIDGVEQSCSANSWCQFDVPDTQISPGKYFLAIKMETNGMISGTDRSGFGQWRTHNYYDPFPDPFGTVADATGSEYSIYACCS